MMGIIFAICAFAVSAAYSQRIKRDFKIEDQLRETYYLLLRHNLIPKENPMPTDPLQLIAAIVTAVTSLQSQLAAALAASGSPAPTTNFMTPDVLAAAQAALTQAQTPVTATPAPTPAPAGS